MDRSDRYLGTERERPILKPLRSVWFLFVSVLVLVGCAPLVDQDQPHYPYDVEALLTSQQSVGQTFVAQHGGLSGIEVRLSPLRLSDGRLTLHVRAEPESDLDLRTSVLSMSDVQSEGYHRFSFEPIPDSHKGYYYVFLTLEGEGRYRVSTAPGDVYLHGALYVQDQPQDAQMTFHLVYDTLAMFVELGRAVIEGLGLLGIAFVLFVVPGWALLAWLWSGPTLSIFEGLGLATGISLALYPVMVLWTGLIGLRLGPGYAWIPTVLGLVALGWRYQPWKLASFQDRLRAYLRSLSLWPNVMMLVLLAMVFATRLIVVRTFEAPLWADSYHHTMITQLIVDNGGLFQSWAPYAELESLTYHFGFHTQMAVLHWLTGMEMRFTVLWGGQILNGLAILTLVPLAIRIGRSAWAGVVAILVAGLLSPMPMTYVNWGRFTQLAGQTILPVAIYLSLEGLENDGRSFRRLSLAWLVVAGLALTHFRVLIFYVFFVVAWALFSSGKLSLSDTAFRIVRIGLVAALIFLPWFLRSFGGRIMLHFGHQLTQAPSERSNFEVTYNAMRPLDVYLVPWLWILAAVSAGQQLWKRNRLASLTVIWGFLLLLATNPQWLNLPGSGAISNFAFFIAVYILIALIIGAFLGPLLENLSTRVAFLLLASACLLGFGGIGATERLQDLSVHPHTLVTRPDLEAFEWIRSNTDVDAKFWVNSYFSYGNYVILGSDAGWWLPLLARRSTSLPPMIYGVEKGPTADYVDKIGTLTERYYDLGIDHPDVLEMLRARGITHIYIGQQQGRANMKANKPYAFHSEGFVASSWYETVYHQDRVWIFELHADNEE
jgi:hypothetical protein